MRTFFLFLSIVFCIFMQKTEAQVNSKNDVTEEGKWIPLFNGKNLDGWIPKVTGYRVGENPLNGFRVENGILKVDYRNFAAFNGRFGHLFWKEKLSSYKLHVEYRFVGEMLPDAPFYCIRNSGVMIHSQSPESMEIAQNWPVSVEIQIMGCTDKLKQTTANVCTPGTTVYYNNLFSNEHCINSTSKYYYDGEWIILDIIVRGSKVITCMVNSDTVLSFSKPQIGGFLLPETFPLPEGTLLNDGYIALQAEGQPIEFRKIDLMYLNETAKEPFLKLIENFDSYSSNEELAKIWYKPGHGAENTRTLESAIKGGGKYSLKCQYSTKKSEDKFYTPFCRVAKWDLSGCNGIKFWFKPDGSGRELFFELNIANKEDKNIHDLWDYHYLTEKGDTTARMVTIPFYVLIHNTKYADTPDVSPVFLPEAVIEVAICIGNKENKPGSGTYYFDEIYGCKLQF